MNRIIEKRFPDLTPSELYQILQLRCAIFIVEQNCPYQDADGLDGEAFHLMLLDEENKLLSYLRILAPGIAYLDHVALGRIVTANASRRKGFSSELIRFAIDRVHKLFPGYPIKISAQCYLELWYGRFGFKAVGEEYMEDDIPHVAMVIE